MRANPVPSDMHPEAKRADDPEADGFDTIEDAVGADL